MSNNDGGEHVDNNATMTKRKRSTVDQAARGTIAMLDLPAGSCVSVDGRVEIVKRDDFVGISHVSSEAFHLVTCRRGSGGSGAVAPAIGFVVLHSPDNDNGHNNNNDENESWIVARRYDPRTEEVSADEVDEMTCRNLCRSVYDNGGRDLNVLSLRVVPYGVLVDPDLKETWLALTNHITTEFLKSRNIPHGTKIVPGCCAEDDAAAATIIATATTTRQTTSTSSLDEDGTHMAYPPVPCFSKDRLFSRKSHSGTSCYLETLTPSQRTNLFIRIASDEAVVLHALLPSYYHNKWQHLVADVQLSFLLFLHLGCLASFEHWRDLLSMLSLEGCDQVVAYTDLYSSFIDTIVVQLQSIDEGFFQEVEYSEGNFFIPALQRLHGICSRSKNNDLSVKMKGLVTLTRERFKIDLLNPFESCEEDSDCDSEDAPEPLRPNDCTMQNIDDDDDDGPIVVPFADVEASWERSMLLDSTRTGGRECRSISYPKALTNSYPLLFAAVCPHEDIVMTCARILDDALDASLVREAASYLEEVEAGVVTE